MQHPILDSKKYLQYYVLVWSIFALLHFFLLAYYYSFSYGIIIADSVSSTVIAALLGLSLWFSLRYGMGDRERTPYEYIGIHLASAIVLLGFWLGLNYMVILIVPNSEDYTSFFSESIIYRFVGGLFFYSILVLFYYLMIYYQNVKEKSANENRLNLLIKEAEIDNLKTQLNPHFLFNSLNSISSLTIQNPEKAQEMVIMLSELLRYSVNGTKHRFVKMEQEIETLRKYVDIEKIRYGDKLRVNYNIDEKCYGFMLPPMILQPLIENAIKYGRGQTGGESGVDILISMTEEHCKISISNNYDSEFVSNVGEGIGLNNIKKRLRIIYEHDYSFDTYDSGTNFTAEMLLPYLKEEDYDQ